MKGKQLHVNASCKGGELRIEILDDAGESINRYTASECRPISDDAVDIPVRWRNNETLEPLVDRPVRFKFHLNKAKLFSFWVELQGRHGGVPRPPMPTTSQKQKGPIREALAAAGII